MICFICGRTFFCSGSCGKRTIDKCTCILCDFQSLKLESERQKEIYLKRNYSCFGKRTLNEILTGKKDKWKHIILESD